MATLTLSDLPAFARTVHERLAKVPDTRAALLALRGQLGAGKTTFVQALARELGVAEPVQSPTYVLMKRYATQDKRFATLVHIDAYRLEEPGQFAALRPEEFLRGPGALVVVEWPERLEGALPMPDLMLDFAEGPTPDQRDITLEE